ncbi:MAG: hypothetical protein H8E21_09155 [Gammaproteobacteria bacterium]|nr:hypothetical protein [Gammaproteobacteria bacterium]MBL6999730.1 hypothetical protein [Gammaproteobacteria bacterium]
MKQFQLYICVVALFFVHACSNGGSNDSSAAVNLVPGNPVAVTLGAAGGGLAAEDLTGSRMTLDFPAGAVTNNVAFTLTPLSAGTDIARFSLSPAGVVPLFPVTVRLSARAALPAGIQFFWVDSEGSVPVGGIVNGSELSAQLPVMGFLTAAAKPAPVGIARRSLTDGSSTVLAVRPVDCDVILDDMIANIQSTVAKGDPDSINRELTAIQNLQIACADRNVENLLTATCNRYRAAETNARVIAVNDEETFERFVGAMIGAHAATELLEVECNPDDFIAVLDQKLEQFLVFMGVKFRNTPISNDIEVHLDQLDDLFRYEGTCALAQESQACGALEDRLFPDLIDVLRDVGYAECVNTGNPFALANLLETPLSSSSQLNPADKVLRFSRFTINQLEADISHCSSSIEVHVFADATEEIVDRQQDLFGGDTVGTHTTEADVVVPVDGTLSLNGSVVVPQCIGAASTGEVLVARVRNTELGRSARNGNHFFIDAFPIAFTVKDALAAAGQPASGGQFDVKVTREGGNCPSYQSPFLMYTIHVDTSEPLLKATLLAVSQGSNTAVSETNYTSATYDEGFGSFLNKNLAADAELPAQFGSGGTTTVFISQPDSTQISMDISTAINAEILVADPNNFSTTPSIESWTSGAFVTSNLVLEPGAASQMTASIDARFYTQASLTLYADRAALDAGIAISSQTLPAGDSAAISLAPPQLARVNLLMNFRNVDGSALTLTHEPVVTFKSVP